MIDHLIRFKNGLDLSAFSLTLLPDTELKKGIVTKAFLGGKTVHLLIVQIVVIPAKYTAEGDLETSEIVASGTWLVVRADQAFDHWKVDSRLVAIANSELAEAGKPCVIYKNHVYPWAAMQGRVRPPFNKSKIPFGPHMNESQLIKQD